VESVVRQDRSEALPSLFFTMRVSAFRNAKIFWGRNKMTAALGSAAKNA
jgi:hypothetical protein